MTPEQMEEHELAISLTHFTQRVPFHEFSDNANKLWEEWQEALAKPHVDILTLVLQHMRSLKHNLPLTISELGQAYFKVIRMKDPHQNITRMLQRIDELRGSVLAVKGGGGKRLDSITASTAAPLEVTPLRRSKTAVASPEPTPGSKVIIRHIEHILEKHKKPTVRNPDHRGHISAARKAENALVEAWHNIEAEVDKTNRVPAGSII